MGDHQHGHAVLRQRLHDAQHLAHHFRVQRGGGLVEQQHLRVHGQGAGDGHPLLLAAGDLPGLGIDVGGHTHLFQIFQRTAAGPPPCCASSTFIWPTMQFSSTVILLNRLKDWNTIPTWERYSGALTPRPATSVPW